MALLLERTDSVETVLDAVKVLQSDEALLAEAMVNPSAVMDRLGLTGDARTAVEAAFDVSRTEVSLAADAFWIE